MATIQLPTVDPATGAITAPGTWNQTIVSEPGTPSTTSKFDLDNPYNQMMIRQLVVDGKIEEPMYQQELTAARSFFTGQNLIKSNFLLQNLKFGQEYEVLIDKDQNPLSLFNKKAIEYTAIDDCHNQIVLDCEIPCVNSLPEIDRLKFRFDTEYSYGVRACDKNTDFWDLGYFTRQYAKSRAGMLFGREIDLWNTVIRGLIASPAVTADAKLAAVHPTHYWANLGSVALNAKCRVPEAYWYLKHTFANINPTVFVTEEFATELVRSLEVVNPYAVNTNFQMVNTFEQWTIPGFAVNKALQTIFGGQIPIVVMKRSPWLTYAATGSGESGFVSQFPLWSEDATKQYVAILDPRVGYEFEKDGYHLVIRPYDCDKLDRGMQDTLYVGRGITFPVYGLIQEYDEFTYC